MQRLTKEEKLELGKNGNKFWQDCIRHKCEDCGIDADICRECLRLKLKSPQIMKVKYLRN